MKKIIFLLAVLIISISAYADFTDTTRQRLTPDEFLIMPWGHYWWTNNTQRDEYFKDMYDCGFNVTHFIPPTEVKFAKKHNLKAHVFVDSTGESDADYATKAQNFTKRVIKEVGKNNLDDLYMVYVQDEPNAREDTVARLSAYADAVRESCKCKPYINLYPIAVSPAGLGVESYDKYIDTITQSCKLDYISYDNYSFSVGNNPDAVGYTNSVRNYNFNENYFYSNLEAIKKGADINRVGFINIIQSVGALSWPDPDDYIIHVQGWSSLAYGAKGISYFTYQTPNLGNWRNAPYDEYNMKSPAWRYVAHMNYAIHNIGAIYKSLKNINVFHMGYVPKGCKDKSSAINVKNLSLSPLRGEANVVAQEFVDKAGKQYAMIVNKNPDYSVAVGIEFNKGNKIFKVEDRSTGGDVKSFGGEDVYIMPGHGVLLYAE
ncbi:MAG: hypothetical protein IJS60_02950 [Abditibacteriota bacterium]|nr:hypothetical protein [Abditibacteriota bacterium]